MRIFSQAPTRISLIGGGTDVNPFASKFGGKVLSFAINLQHHVSLEPIKSKEVIIETGGIKKRKSLGDRLEYGKDEGFDLVYAIINYFRPFVKTGFKLKVDFDGESSGGLGSSASAAVSIIGVFNHWLKRGLTRMEIAFLAWRMEVEELGWPGGKQDQLAAVFGGVNLLTFGLKDSAGVIPLDLPPGLIKKMRAWILLFYIGGKRHSGDLQKKLTRGMDERERIEALKKLKRGVGLVIKKLRKGDFKLVGKVLDGAWEFKKRSNPAIATGRINDLYELAKKNGALGGKIMGAGAGGHMFFICPPKNQSKVISALKEDNCQVVDFEFDFEGLKTWQKD